jgi:hypothetical protein
MSILVLNLGSLVHVFRPILRGIKKKKKKKKKKRGGKPNEKIPGIVSIFPYASSEFVAT